MNFITADLSALEIEIFSKVLEDINVYYNFGAQLRGGANTNE